MGEVRCWHVVRATGIGERQRIACVEVDLAADSAGRGLDLAYRPFGTDDIAGPVLTFAETMSSFGAQTPDRRSVLVITRGTRNRRFAERYPGLTAPEYAGATIVSADAAEVAVVREAVRRGALSVDGARLRTTDTADATLTAVVERVTVDGRWFYLPAGKSDFRVKNTLDGAVDIVAPLNPGTGFLSEHDAASAAAFNGGYFLWVEEETDDPFSFAQDHVGLLICDGEVLAPPILRRSALLTTQTVYPREEDERRFSLGAPRAVIASVSLENYAVRLPDGLVVGGRLCRREHLMRSFEPFESVLAADVNPARADDTRAAFYNRLFDTAGEVTSTHTPPAAGRVELVISRDEIVAVRQGGGTFIPRNGFVVSVPDSACDAGALLALAGEPAGPGITQTVDIGDHALKPVSGVQTGPRILRDGAKADVLADLTAGREQFVSIDAVRGERGCPPVYVFHDRHVTPGVARIAFGIKDDGRCVVVMFEGSEARTFDAESDARGASTEDVTEFLLSLGCRDAVALDGGGSAEITFGGRPVVRVADRNDVPFFPARRLVPGRWLVGLRDRTARGTCAS